MKINEYLSLKRNRTTVIYINVAMSVLLGFIAVWLDSMYGAAALIPIYIMQAVCIINWVIAFSLMVLNLWFKSRKKLENRDKYRGRDK